MAAIPDLDAIARRVEWAEGANYRVTLDAAEGVWLLAEIETLRMERDAARAQIEVRDCVIDGERAENRRLRAENDLLLTQVSRHASRA